MKIIYRSASLILIPLILFSVIFASCSEQASRGSGRVVAAIPEDVESFNPLFAYNYYEGMVHEMLYLSLFQYKWNENEGILEAEPMLAESWQWNNDTTSVTINLRDDVYWSDSVKVTAEDVVFSYDMYSDPDIQSRFYGAFNILYLEKDLSIDIDKTFKIISPYVLQINFVPGSVPSVDKIDLPIVAKHVYEKYDRKTLVTESANIKPVTNGAYYLSRWDKNQAIILKADKKSFLHKPGAIKEFIFKIVPDYNSRITQLKKGEVDLVEDVQPADAASLKKYNHIALGAIKGREYEYIGWNNIDPARFKRGEIAPHKLFGSAGVRRALTYAINRKEILEEYLYNNGQPASTPVAPIFKTYYDSSVAPYPYDPEKAKQILAEEGWADRNNDGIIEKGNTEFRFTLTTTAGNPRRNFAVTIIKNNLKAVGIDVNIELSEIGSLLEKITNREMDAWLLSWFMGLPLDLKDYWYSNIKTNNLNNSGYRNKEADAVLTEIAASNNIKRNAELYKRIQAILYNDQPVTFMYWINNITASNTRIKNLKVTPFGFITSVWDWRVE